MTEAPSRPHVAIVVAVSSNGIIGRDSGLPWHLPTDLKRFRALTIGKPVVMGRRTFASIGRPLPGRANIVISRDPAFSGDGIIVAASLDEALIVAQREAAHLGTNMICVIGGGEIYAQAMDRADSLFVTEVETATEGDTRFPDIDAKLFEKVSDEPVAGGEKDSHPMRFVTWRRRPAIAR